MRSHSFYSTVLVLTPLVAGLNISTNDPDDLSLAASQVASGVLSFYDGDEYGNAVGTFPDPYYWWEYGMAWDALVNYWYLTGDGSHNAVVQAALDAQQGETHNYMPANQTKSLMNDDQAMWGLAAMTAAERGFPLAANEVAWEQRASNVFDNLAARWDTATCGGGLRWAIFTFQAGYNYKNSVAQGLFFQLAARLARFTGNQTYVDWASRSYDWARSTGLIDPDTSAVYDGTYTAENCTTIVRYQWSYLATSFAYGSAILANITSNTTWSDRASSHLSNTLSTFFPDDDNIIQEVACEPSANCDTDQLAFPALTLRWLALLPVFQPATADAIGPALDASAVAAASHCSTVDDGDAGPFAKCTNNWSDETGVKKTTGLSQQLVALDALLATYVVERDGGVNASVVLRSATTSSGGNGNGTESSGGDGTSATTSGSNAEATGTSVAAGSVRASCVLVAIGFAMACLL